MGAVSTLLERGRIGDRLPRRPLVLLETSPSTRHLKSLWPDFEGLVKGWGKSKLSQAVAMLNARE